MITVQAIHVVLMANGKKVVEKEFTVRELKKVLEKWNWKKHVENSRKNMLRAGKTHGEIWKKTC